MAHSELVDDVPAIRRIAIKLTPLAIAAIVQNLVDPTVKPGEKRKNAELLLAYGWGRPMPVKDMEDKKASNVLIDYETQEKLSKTFDRINQALATSTVSPETESILKPILELEHLTDERGTP